MSASTATASPWANQPGCSGCSDPDRPTFNADTHANMIRQAIKNCLFRIVYPISRTPQTPKGHDLQSLLEMLRSFDIDGSSSSELESYLAEDFLRFVHTLDLIPKSTGKLLEIGSNPYFTSILIKKFTDYALSCTNYFGGEQYTACQTMINRDSGEEFSFEYLNHNAETDDFSFDEKFDVTLFCEVIEHLSMDPLQALLRIKSTLKVDGYLILSTPNVNRLENVAKMLAGANIYDPYSGYGPYGRHNREYNRHELVQLLTHAGFDVEIVFTSDVHRNLANHYVSLLKILPLVFFRRYDLGQYLFIRARNARPANPLKPSWLYRSYSADQLC